MADTVDRETRSKIMASIGGRDTRPEVTLRKALHALGLRYRLHRRDLPGRPDIVFPKFRAVVFVHGCFWHRHEGCRYAYMPSSNVDFWEEKFRRNVERDRRNMKALLSAGWRVAVVWECALKKRGASETAELLAKWLRDGMDDQLLELS